MKNTLKPFGILSCLIAICTVQLSCVDDTELKTPGEKGPAITRAGDGIIWVRNANFAPVFLQERQNWCVFASMAYAAQILGYNLGQGYYVERYMNMVLPSVQLWESLDAYNLGVRSDFIEPLIGLCFDTIIIAPAHITDWIREGLMVMTDIMGVYPNTHSVVVVGCYEINEYLIVADPGTGTTYSMPSQKIIGSYTRVILNSR